jgi:DNA-binding transcriptional ArsR family regulator
MKPLTSLSDPRIVRALAHPVRLRILSILEERVASPKEIAREIGAPLTHVSYHVRQLAQLGLIKLDRTTPRRGAVEHHYRMDASPSISDDAWREAPAIAKEALIGVSLELLSTQVNAAAAEEGFSRVDSHLARLPLELDEEGWVEASKAIAALVDELERIQADAKERARGTHDEPISTMVVLMQFEAAARQVPQTRTTAAGRRSAAASVPPR